jgi:ArsR family transcriptional regulator
MKAMADETRLRILNLLRDQELNVNELVTILEMGQSRVSRHLKILADSGLVTSRRDGLWVFYSLSDYGALQPFLKQALLLIETMPGAEEDQSKREYVLTQRNKETSRLFDSLAKNWKHIKAELFGDVKVVEEIYKIFPECHSVVDIGCGTGDLLVVLRDKVKKVIGVDNSPKMLEQAAYYLNRENHGPGISSGGSHQPGSLAPESSLPGHLPGSNNSVDLRLGTIEHLPLGNREVESAVINMVLHHTTTPLLIFKEANRVLIPGGYLVVVDFKKHRQEILRTQYGDRHLGFSPGELEAYFQKGGFLV